MTRLKNLYLSFPGRNDSKEFSKLWDSVLVDSARGSQVYHWAEKEETSDDVASLSMFAYLRNMLDPLYGHRFVKRLEQVRVDDVQRAAVKYLPQFLDIRKTMTAIVCNPNEVESIKYKLSELNVYLKSVDNLDVGILVD